MFVVLPGEKWKSFPRIYLLPRKARRAVRARPEAFPGVAAASGLEVSSTGRARASGELLPTFLRAGYAVTAFHGIDVPLQRAVAICFVPLPRGKNHDAFVVWPKNGDPADVRMENLEWVLPAGKVAAEVDEE